MLMGGALIFSVIKWRVLRAATKKSTQRFSKMRKIILRGDLLFGSSPNTNYFSSTWTAEFDLSSSSSSSWQLCLVKSFVRNIPEFSINFFQVDLIDQSGQIVGLADLDENQPFEKMKKFIKISAEFFLIVRKDDSDWQLWSQMPEEKPLQKLIEKRLSELVNQFCLFKLIIWDYSENKSSNWNLLVKNINRKRAKGFHWPWLE